MAFDSYIQLSPPVASTTLKHGTFNLPPPASSSPLAVSQRLASRVSMGNDKRFSDRLTFTQKGQALY